MQTASFGLNEVARELMEWRRQKKTKYERIPAELLNRVRALRNEGAFSDAEICKTTGLSACQLTGRKAGAKKNEDPGFVEIPSITAQVSEPVVIEIHDGQRSIIVRVAPQAIDVGKLLGGWLVGS